MNYQKGDTNTILIVIVIIIILVGGYWFMNREEAPANDGLQINVGASGNDGSGN
jgi:FtsZ-interacting cell division protein ZipA